MSSHSEESHDNTKINSSMQSDTEDNRSSYVIEEKQHKNSVDSLDLALKLESEKAEQSVSPLKRQMSFFAKVPEESNDTIVVNKAKSLLSIEQYGACYFSNMANIFTELNNSLLDHVKLSFTTLDNLLAFCLKFYSTMTKFSSSLDSSVYSHAMQVNKKTEDQLKLKDIFKSFVSFSTVLREKSASLVYPDNISSYKNKLKLAETEHSACYEEIRLLTKQADQLARINNKHKIYEQLKTAVSEGKESEIFLMELETAPLTNALKENVQKVNTTFMRTYRKLTNIQGELDSAIISTIEYLFAQKELFFNNIPSEFVEMLKDIMVKTSERRLGPMELLADYSSNNVTKYGLKIQYSYNSFTERRGRLVPNLDDFVLNTYESVESYLSHLLKLDFPEINSNNSTLVKRVFKVVREKGYFKGSCASYIVITRQDNCLLFDKAVTKENLIDCMEMKYLRSTDTGKGIAIKGRKQGNVMDQTFSYVVESEFKEELKEMFKLENERMMTAP